jgi:magnesium-transporting ATPase (P-type)
MFFMAFQFYPNVHFAMFTFFQFTYIYITVHTFPALALIVDKFPRGVMKEPPRDSEEIFTRPLVKLMIIQGVFMGLGIVLAYLIPIWGLAPFNAVNGMGYTPPTTLDDVIIFGLDQAKGRTMAMTVIFIAETLIIWSMRRPNSSIKDSFFKEFNKWLMIMIIFVWFLHFGAMYFGSDVNPALINLLGSGYYLGWVFLNGTDWLWVILLSLMGIIAVELYKMHERRNNRFF